MTTTETENRQLVEKMLGYSGPATNPDFTFLTGDQMLLLLEAMAKRGLEIQLVRQNTDVEWQFYTCKWNVWTLRGADITAPAAVRAAALAVIAAT